MFRGERDRRASPHHVTGRQDLDDRRAETETISKQIPPGVMKRIREAIERGELPRSL